MPIHLRQETWPNRPRGRPSPQAFTGYAGPQGRLLIKPVAGGPAASPTGEDFVLFPPFADHTSDQAVKLGTRSEWLPLSRGRYDAKLYEYLALRAWTDDGGGGLTATAVPGDAIALRAAITVELANETQETLAEFQWAGGGMDHRLSIELSLGGLTRIVKPRSVSGATIAKLARATVTSECQGNPTGAWRVQWNLPLFHFLFIPPT